MDPEEETIKEAESITEEVKTNVEYGFIVLKTKEGDVRVQPFNDKEEITKPPTFDDIYNCCTTICRNIETQQTAQAIAQMMAQVAKQQPTQDGMKKTEGGIVIPS